MHPRSAGKRAQPLEPTDFYHVRRVENVVEFRTRSDRGPGLFAVFVLICAAGAGGVFLTSYVVLGVWMTGYVRAGENPPAPGGGIIPWGFPLGVLPLLAVLCFAGALKVWRDRGLPLRATSAAGLTFGRRELAAPGQAKAVWLERSSRWTDAESGPDVEQRAAYLYVERRDGSFVELPRLFFSELEGRFFGFEGWQVGAALAGAVAEALGVPLIEKTPPARVSAPQRRERSQRLLWGGLLLPIGLLFYSAGWGALLVEWDSGEWMFPGVFAMLGGGVFLMGCRLAFTWRAPRWRRLARGMWRRPGKTLARVTWGARWSLLALAVWSAALAYWFL